MPYDQTHELIKIDQAQREELLRRAYVAWFKSGGMEAPAPASGVKMRLGLAYVVLHGAADVLAVYRVRQVRDYLMLRRMVRWPQTLGL